MIHGTTLGRRLGKASSILALGVFSTLAACSGDDTSAPAEKNDGEQVFIDQYSGSFVVQSVFRGDQECLDANYLDPDTSHGGAYMAPCDGSDPQVWQFTAVEQDLYEMSTDDENERVCLDGNDKESVIHEGAAFVDVCRRVPGQLWTLTETEDGLLRLHSEFREQAACLESNEPGSEAHSGAAFMDDCQNVTGQFWRLVPTGETAKAIDEAEKATEAQAEALDDALDETTSTTTNP